VAESCTARTTFGERRRNKKEGTVAKKFEDLTPEEKSAAFDKWMETRTARRGVSAIKRKAAKTLVDKYPDEYNKYLAAATSKVKS